MIKCDKNNCSQPAPVAKYKNKEEEGCLVSFQTLNNSIQSLDFVGNH